MADEEKRDIKLIELLTNKPSEPLEIESSNVRIVFQAPSFTDKYKGRSWASKKLKQIGITEDDDQDLTYYFRYWGTINSYVKHVYVESDNGEIKISGKNYFEYEFSPNKDLDYSSVYEKYVLEEMYPRGLDEQFVTSTIIAHMNWIRDRALEEEEIKKS
jgi:hypothetical protein